MENDKDKGVFFLYNTTFSMRILAFNGGHFIAKAVQRTIQSRSGHAHL